MTFNSNQIDDDAPLLDNNAAIASDDVDIIIRPESTRINIAGNNVLNNLSGSFREENEIATNSARTKNRSAPNILQNNEDDGEATTSSNSSPPSRRLAVAAIPNNVNIQFLSSQRHHDSDSIARE